MFVEGEVEIIVKDRAAERKDDHGMKLWVQRAFKNMSCYRLSDYRRDKDKKVHVIVALNTSVLPDAERQALESNPADTAKLRAFMEKMFEGQGTMRVVSTPQLRPS